ncbi:uncharacterized protein LOC122659059 [Telopea speciosissima]|uniref:uncharacterized protein LOC122659059 n=1 Tax=Telopea speciosissima TaxID=54955 RepID=UPI001CC80ADD|nr:uncharacterized protein LOC122659059 [Telopea speciosissima]
MIATWNALLPSNKQAAEEYSGVASYICYNLWKARNDLLFNGKDWSPVEVVRQAENEFQEFNLIAGPAAGDRGHHDPIKSTEEASHNLCWSPPPPSFFKLNSDASLVGDIGGLGFVLYDSVERPTMAFSEPSSFNLIFQGEALALRVGLFYSIAEMIDDIIVESDNLDLVKYLTDLKTPPQDSITFVQDIGYLPSFPHYCSFKFVPREINSVADSLARRVGSIGCRTL